VLVARDPRRLGFDVGHDPLPDNFAPFLMVGEYNRDKCRALAELTRVLIPPQPPAGV
jgi:hypothetical protein